MGFSALAYIFVPKLLTVTKLYNAAPGCTNLRSTPLTKLDFDSDIAVIYFRYEKVARLGEARKDRIEQAIFDVLGVDFEVIITCNENDAYNNVDDELIEGDNLETITLKKLEQAKKNLLPNQSIIGRGWIELLNPSRD
ncbi:MAG: hypothetical protein WBA93_07610 [Microcoleaceae cyanobacterium]